MTTNLASNSLYEIKGRLFRATPEKRRGGIGVQHVDRSTDSKWEPIGLVVRIYSPGDGSGSCWVSVFGDTPEVTAAPIAARDAVATLVDLAWRSDW